MKELLRYISNKICVTKQAIPFSFVTNLPIRFSSQSEQIREAVYHDSFFVDVYVKADNCRSVT
jgi:hypothetical protein